MVIRRFAIGDDTEFNSAFFYYPNQFDFREVKRGSSGTIHYVFEGTEPIFENALGKHLARADGVIGDSTAKVYYYDTD